VEELLRLPVMAMYHVSFKANSCLGGKTVWKRRYEVQH